MWACDEFPQVLQGLDIGGRATPVYASLFNDGKLVLTLRHISFGDLPSSAEYAKLVKATLDYHHVQAQVLRRGDEVTLRYHTESADESAEIAKVLKQWDSDAVKAAKHGIPSIPSLRDYVDQRREKAKRFEGRMSPSEIQDDRKAFYF